MPLDGGTGRRAGRRDLPGHGLSSDWLFGDEDGRDAKAWWPGEFGQNADGTPGAEGYEPGMELRGKYVSSGRRCARGSLSKQVIAKYGLDDDAERGEVRPRDEGNLGG